MSRRSRYETRSNAKDHLDVSDDERDTSHDRSYASSRSLGNDSNYGSASFRSRNDSDSDSRSHSSFHSPNKSMTSCSSSTPSSIYPKLPLSSDSSFNESGHEGRGGKIYPNLKSTSGNTSRNTSSYRKVASAPDKKVSESQNNNTSQVGFILIAILAIIAILVYLVKPNSTQSSDSNQPMMGYELFEKDIKVLQTSFPSQTRRFWNTMSASARHVFEQQDPCYPSVILMASHNKNQRLNACLAKKIAATFSNSRGINSRGSVAGTDVEVFKHLEPEKQKKYLDDALQSAFQRDGEKAYVINNVHSLSPKAALLLHGFCDGDNAPYQDVMIILTFQVEDRIDFHSVKEVEDFLVGIWSQGLDMDKLSALMSRIANNPVVLMQEEDSVMNQMCS